MTIINFYSELQMKPRNKVVYRKIIDHYKSMNMHNEADAFQYLIKRKFDDNGTYIDKEQYKNDSKDS